MPNWKTYESSVRLLSAILAAHPDIKLNYSEIAKAFGGDCTKWAIDNRFRSLKTDAKRISDALASGLDPGDLVIPANRKGRNSSIADNSAPKTPRTPKKKATKKAASDEDNEDDDEAEMSPSKFTPKKALNKIKEGRITKSRTPRKSAAVAPTYIESENEDEEDDADKYAEDKISSIVVKPETNDNGAALSNGQDAYHTGNGLFNGNSNSYLGYEVEGDDVFHLAPGQQYENDFGDDQV